MNRDNIQTIEHYKVLEVIGQGGMSTVYRAVDTQSQQTVALKVMHPYLSDKPDFQRRFLAECRAAAALQHPNIIRIFDMSLQNGRLVLVMEYIGGQTLRKRLNAHLGEGTYMDFREIVTITRQVAQALHYAHNQGIIHRDVKPDNVLMRSGSETDTTFPDVQTVLTDFGLAKRIDGVGNVTTTGELLGTLAYMAPEQFRDEPLDGRVDIYSLGVMLYELVCGRPPFSSTSPIDLILMHTQGEPERILDLRPETPDALVSIIHRAMLKNPDDRYETAGEIARELEALEKTIGPITDVIPWRKRQKRVVGDSPVTVYDVLPALDRPAIPVDLFSEGTDDLIIVTPLDGPSWSLPFEKPSIIVGREASCDLRLDDSRVSRQHLRIDRLPDGQIAVVDMGSLNGLFMGDAKLEKNQMIAWPASQSVKVGPFWLTLRPAKVQKPKMALVPRTIETLLSDDVSALRLTPAESAVEPGKATIVRVEIINRREVDQQFTLTVQGISPEWFTVAPYPLHVPPDETLERLITFHPPRLPTSESTDHKYRLMVTPQGQDRQITMLDGTLHVFPYYAFTSAIEPGGRGATIHITNQGNSQRSYVVELREPANVLVMLPSRARVMIAPGQSAAIDIRVRPKRRPMFGNPQRYPVEVFIRTDGLRPHTQSFDFALNPLLPTEVVAALLLALALLVIIVLTR